jgi:hypothetical protein
MNFLPVVDRELRVAARKRSTFWARIAGAGIGVVLGAGFLLLHRLQGTIGSQLGAMLFGALVWLCLAAGLLAGLFLTSDCLSQEKREGTLGLLFLTQLHGYDVALGKLLATSLRGFYGLLAVLPILALTQLLGGISAAQYWQSSLAVLNGLFLSLAAGMLVSTISRDSQKALAGTLLLLSLLTFGGPLLDSINAARQSRAFHAFWSLSSPGFALLAAGAWGRSPFWAAIAINQALGWAMLGLACALVPRTWQERGGAPSSRRGWTFSWKYGGSRRRERLRAKLLGRAPMTWLVCRERWQALGVWTLTILATGGMAGGLLMGKHSVAGWMMWSTLGQFFTLFLYLWAASQAGRFFIEARRSGLLELLLATPLSERQIVAGQWRAFIRMFGLPVLLLAGMHGMGVTLSQLSLQRLAPVPPVRTAPSPSGTNRPGTVVTGQTTVVTYSAVTVFAPTVTVTPLAGARRKLTLLHWALALFSGAARAISTLANLAALCWFGLWMGMTSKSANQATLRTLLFVQVIPWFAISFGSGLAMPLLMMSSLYVRGSSNPSAAMLLWIPMLSALLEGGLAVAKDAGFILWSRKRLHSSLRERAASWVGEGLKAAYIRTARA